MLVFLRCLMLIAAVAGASAAHSPAAESQSTPGVSDTQIKIGQTIPYSGPASSFATIGHTQVAFYRMVNDTGGVNGRKIDFISLDDGYSPPKTVEQTRRLVEQDQVFGIFGSLGTPTNASVQRYLNERKVPQMFLFTGTSRFRDPQHYPWTMGGDLSFVSETRGFARFILKEKPDAKIAVLYQNDDYGKDHLNTLTAALGEKAKTMIVAEASYEVTDPTVDSQVVALKASGADTLLDIALPKFAAQAIRKVAEVDWHPLHIVPYPASSIPLVMQPAGLDHSVGVVTSEFLKEPGDPVWQTDPEVRAYLDFMKKYNPGAELVERDRLLHGGCSRRGPEELRRRGDTRAAARTRLAYGGGGGADADPRDHAQHHPDRLPRDQADAAEAIRWRALGPARRHHQRINRISEKTTRNSLQLHRVFVGP
jgi:branched-chain amino acid transport system substrate-binding protein